MKKHIISALICGAMLSSAAISAFAYTRYDTNSDSVVNSKDIVKVMKTIADGLTGKIEDFHDEEKSIMLACDVNEDGILNSHDLVSLMKYISEGKPGNTSESNVTETNIPDTDVPDTNVSDTDAPDTDVPGTDIPETDAPEIIPEFSSFEGDRLPFTVLWSGDCTHKTGSSAVLAESADGISAGITPLDRSQLQKFEAALETADTEKEMLIAFILDTNGSDTPFRMHELVLHDGTTVGLFSHRFDGRTHESISEYAVVISMPRDDIPENFESMPFGVSLYNTEQDEFLHQFGGMYYREPFPFVYILKK